MIRSGICATVFGIAIAMLGCAEKKEKLELAKMPDGTERSNPQQPGEQRVQPESSKGPFAAGIGVFAANDCKKCHEVDASAKGKAPNLATIGKEHNAEWIIAQVKNPKTHKPESKMPAFGEKISDDDLKALGEYLASLK